MEKMIENPIIASGERHNSRNPYPIDLLHPCECGLRESVAVYKGRQHLCSECLEGLMEVRLL